MRRTTEVQALESVLSELHLTLASMTNERAKNLRAKTWIGRLLNAWGWIMSGYCLSLQLHMLACSYHFPFSLKCIDEKCISYLTQAYVLPDYPHQYQ